MVLMLTSRNNTSVKFYTTIHPKLLAPLSHPVHVCASSYVLTHVILWTHTKSSKLRIRVNNMIQHSSLLVWCKTIEILVHAAVHIQRHISLWSKEWFSTTWTRSQLEETRKNKINLLPSYYPVSTTARTSPSDSDVRREFVYLSLDREAFAGVFHQF